MTGVHPGSPAAMAATPGETEARQGLRLICRGVVQGVGFRPAVARLSGALGLDGRLRNITGAVQVELAGSRPALERFLALLPESLPAAARLEALQIAWLQPPLPPGLAPGSGLHISAEAPQPLGIGLVAPSLVADQAPCPACRRELRDPQDRRFRYPFISCCSCGPRYSIATAAPFARAHTTLAAFALCPACQAEFEDRADRRFHAETIGCPACGPRLRLLDGGGRLLAGQQSDPLAPAVALLRSGRILALQGVGGFQLLVDAGDPGAVARLRERKRRPHKPFALLVDRLERLAGLVHPSPEERAALEDPAAPIVLLPCPDAAHETVLAGVAPGAPGLGVMLPASPLHLLLAEAFAGPLVATSGNRSGEPLCIDPAEAVERLAGIADAFLVHDRPIARPLDDSLLQLIDGRPALLRRARGHAPQALILPEPEAAPRAAAPARATGHWEPAQPRSTEAAAAEGPHRAGSPRRPATGDGRPAVLLALGSDLKSAPALAIGNQLWLSPHLGDLADSRCLERWRSGLDELLGGHSPERLAVAVAVDAHPQYLSHQLAPQLLPATAIQPLQEVQHHQAHALAVAAEHGLPLPLPALVLDGLGYGGGAVPLWGCELLWLDGGDAYRLASLRPFPLPGGERAVREPRRSALGLLWAAGLLDHPGAAAVQAAFQPGEIPLLRQAMASGCHSPWCSSAGRLFDGVASLLDLVQIASHDAHAGLLLQAGAARAPATAGAYPLAWLTPTTELTSESGATSGRVATSAGEERRLPLLNWQPLLLALLQDIASGQARDLCAARFHNGLVQALAEAVCGLGRERSAGSGSDPLAPGSTGPAAAPGVILAGGCFQNRWLLEGLIAALRQRHLEPYWGERIPLNDGGLAAGQILALKLEPCQAGQEHRS